MIALRAILDHIAICVVLGHVGLRVFRASEPQIEPQTENIHYIQYIDVYLSIHLLCENLLHKDGLDARQHVGLDCAL